MFQTVSLWQPRFLPSHPSFPSTPLKRADALPSECSIIQSHTLGDATGKGIEVLVADAEAYNAETKAASGVNSNHP
jgi:hypothetical protein